MKDGDAPRDLLGWPAKREMKKIWYWSMFAVQSAGMLFILYEALPLYRRLLRGPGEDQPGSYLFVPGVCVVIVMQVCYWGNRNVRLRLGLKRNVFLGHILLYLARLSFIFAGAMLSLALFVRSADTRLSSIGIAILVATTFAQFCYARELEALARELEKPG